MNLQFERKVTKSLVSAHIEAHFEVFKLKLIFELLYCYICIYLLYLLYLFSYMFGLYVAITTIV